MKIPFFLFSTLCSLAIAEVPVPNRPGLPFNPNPLGQAALSGTIPGPVAGMSLPLGIVNKPVPLEIHHTADMGKLILELAAKTRTVAAAAAHPLTVFLADTLEAYRVARGAGKLAGWGWKGMSKLAPGAYLLTTWNAANAPIDIGMMANEKRYANNTVNDELRTLNYLMLLAGGKIKYQGKEYTRDEIDKLLRTLQEQAYAADASDGRILREVGKTLIPWAHNDTAIEQHKSAVTLTILACAIRDLNISLAEAVAADLSKERAKSIQDRKEQKARLLEASYGKLSCKLIVHCEIWSSDGKFVPVQRTVEVPQRFPFDRYAYLDRDHLETLQIGYLRQALGSHWNKNGPPIKPGDPERPNWGCLDTKMLGYWYNARKDRPTKPEVRDLSKSDLFGDYALFRSPDPTEAIVRECSKVGYFSGNVFLSASSYKVADIDTQPDPDPKKREVQEMAIGMYASSLQNALYVNSAEYQRHVDRAQPRLPHGYVYEPPKMVPRR